MATFSSFNPLRRIDFRSPLTWILVVIGLLHIVGIGWGLPASDGWDNDGVAPRDLLPGLASSFTPGAFYTYPPVHLALLAVLTLPITLIALLRAPSFAIPDVVHEIIKVPYMTSIAYIARFVSFAMSLAIVLFTARIAQEIRASSLGVDCNDARATRVAWCTAALVGMNASLTYYAHTSNLDVPYLFWATWSLLVFVRALTREEPRLLRRAFALAVLAIGSKDQAYAMFLLSWPLVLACWFFASSLDRKRMLREVAIALGLAMVLFLIVDCVIVNPSGFRARLAFLTGSASQDYVEYTNDWSGRLGVLRDGALRFHFFYPNVIAIMMVGGVILALRGARGARELAIAGLPLIVAISFTVAFNFTARRTDARFLLPQSIMLAIYGGLAIERIVFATQRAVRIVGQGAMSVAFAMGVFVCVSVDANMLFDPRYDAEEWLLAHVKPGDTIETYGLNVYMPRLSKLTSIPDVHVTRVGPEPIDKRNPMLGVEEVQAPFEDAPKRNARFIVISTGWVWRYLNDLGPPRGVGPGQQLPPVQSRSAHDEEATRFFGDLVRSIGSFQSVHDAKYDDHVFPVVNVHGTTTEWIWIYERKSSPPPPPK